MSLLHEDLLKSVVCIGSTQNKKFNANATGYLVGFEADKNNPEHHHTFLVTNRHVFENIQTVTLRFNSLDGKSSQSVNVDLIENKKPIWLAHPNKDVDLAMLTISTQYLEQQKIEYKWIAESMIAYPEHFTSKGIGVGSDVFVLGFPMGLSGNLRNYVIARHGSIARLDPELIKKERSLLVDTLVFPGNSGGPVLVKPQMMAVGDNPPIQQPYLLGTVSGYKPYQEILFSHQSSPPTPAAINMENSGLASVVPMNFAKDTYKKWKVEKIKLEKAAEDMKDKARTDSTQKGAS